MPEKPKINLAALFKMKPKIAAEYLAQKTSRETNHWYEVYEKQHDKIFTVARTAGYDVLADIRAAVQKAIDEGRTLKEFQKELRPVLEEKGWWGKAPDVDNPKQEVQLGSVRRLETIYTTNLRTAYQAGRYQDLMDNVKYRPYWQYIAVMDDRTRKEHKELNGKVFRWDSPFWNTFFPPNGWNCRCTVKSLSQKDVDRLGLTVENTDGKLIETTVELPNGLPVLNRVYRDGKTTVHADKGWNYNPGKTTYQPDYDGKDPQLFKSWIEESVASKPFKKFMESKEKGQYRIIGILSPDIEPLIREKTGSKTSTVNLSSDTVIEHLGKHDDLLQTDYHRLPGGIWNPDYIFLEDAKGNGTQTLHFYKEDSDGEGYVYKIPVKLTKNKDEMFVTSFYRSSLKNLLSKKNGKIIFKKN